MITISFKTNKEDFLNDYMDIIRAFYPHVIFDDNSDKVIILNVIEFSDHKKLDLEISNPFENNNIYKKSINLEEFKTIYGYKSQIKRHSKIVLYDLLSELTNTKLPYGALTGIRPTKLFHEKLITMGYNDAKKYFSDVLRVSKEKTDLLEMIVKNQEGIYNHNDNEVDVFVNIPICLTRCSYCSFISAELNRVKKLVEPYTNLLLKEIEKTKEIITKNNYEVRSVYVGGGTPTSIDDDNFSKIVMALDFNCNEYTVEAGRPDTITFEKLKAMKKANVTRISINPQTFSQKTLDLIGRKHTIEDIYVKYKMAREFGFDINMDLIAMLPNETLDDFKISVDKTIELQPENITVHTLALKRGSILMEKSHDNTQADMANDMVNYAMEKIIESGYEPYYMYKQKHASGNLENVGYCKKGKACIYNVDIMEETNTIIANGAGAISKKLDNSNNSLERLANPKAIDIYIQRDSEILNNKEIFFKL